MTDYEAASIALGVAVAIVATATLVIYYRQLKLMARQLSAMEEASRAQGALSLVAFLQTAEARDARHHVRATLTDKPLAEWNAEDRKAASLVVANYDVTAAMLRSNLAAVELIADNWGPSITHCHQVLRPFILEQRARPGGSERYWRNFEWIAAEAAKRHGLP